MKLLFITYDFYPGFGANSLIISTLAQFLVKKGHEVHALPVKFTPDAGEEESWNNIRIHRITQSFDRKQVLKYMRGLKFRKALRLLLAIFKDRFNRREYLKSYWSYFSGRQLSGILKQYGIDLVINVCYPFEACLPVMNYIAREGKRFRWIIYMQDPFAANYYYLNRYPVQELASLQARVFHAADKIIVTKAIWNELEADGDQVSLGKAKILNFPMVKSLDRAASEDGISFSSRYINCVYVGRFNEDTRNPRRLFALFELFRREHIRLHIIGEVRERWMKYLSEASDNIFFYGERTKETAVNAELEANILINLGNSVSNQLPSKLLEYISTGKPIINIYKTEDCPTLEYMARYPLGLNIAEYGLDYETISTFRQFCLHFRNRSVNSRYIVRQYQDCTVEYVSNEFLKLCSELVPDTPQGRNR
jgi:glycosyltransferase involved in cell wall biosynthesis